MSVLEAARMEEMSWRDLVAEGWVLGVLVVYLRYLAEVIVQ